MKGLKMRLYTMAAALAMLSSLSTAAIACDPGQYEVVTSPGDPSADPVVPPTTACFNRFNLGHGTATTGEINPEGGVVQGGRGSGTEVHGTYGTALGDHAIVGRWIPAVPASEDYVPAHCTESTECTPASPDYVAQTGTAAVPAHAAPVNYGTAIGAGASVQHDHSTAIGAGAESTYDHQVTVGTSGDTLRAPGIASDLSASRQSGPLGVVTTDRDGNLAADFGLYGRLDSQGDVIHANSLAIAGLRGDVSKLYKLNSMAMAMPDAYLGEHEKFSIAGGTGFAGDKFGFGSAMAIRIDQHWSGYGGVAFSEGEVAGKVGARFGW
jgi:hypothetical protein